LALRNDQAQLLQLNRISRRFNSSDSSTTPVPPPPPTPRKSGWRRFFSAVGRYTIITTVVGGGAFYYIALKDRTPGEQLPHDPSKKNLVILGSGWAATSLLNSLDTADYNVYVVSPRNYFLFTPLLPSVAVGTLGPRSILQPTRYVTRHKARQVQVIEAGATDVDPFNKTVTFTDTSEIQGLVSSQTLSFDYLVYAVGAETQTFNIPGVKEHACFMKELEDAEKMQRRFLDCLESAAFPGQSEDEINRMLHVVVVGGGPTGIELSGEIHDFLEQDLKSWYPELANHIRISLVEALPSVLPSFSKQLIEYTESTFKEAKIDILTKTMVKEIKEQSVVLQGPDGVKRDVPCGMVVWAAGNTLRKVTKDLLAKLPEYQTNKRGILVDDHLRMLGTDGIYALGDCTATTYAPTAQVASQQGAYLARILNRVAKKETILAQLFALDLELGTIHDPEVVKKKQEKKVKLEKELGKVEKIRPFKYSHQGSLAYIGSDKAIADLPFSDAGNVAMGGVATYLFWRSAYLSQCFSLRNRALVASDWIKVKLFGRDVSREG